MIIFLSGKDTYRSRQHLTKMVNKFKQDRDPQRLNVVKLDSAKEKPGTTMEQILAMPFLAEKRMIVLENLLSSKHKELMEELLQKIKDKKLPETNIIIFWEGTDKFKTKAAKALQAELNKEKFSQQFDELKGWQLSNWIKEEIANRGGKIENNALQYLATNLPGDMWQLNSVIDQLVAYKNGEIGVEDVMLFLEEKVDDNIFNLVDNIVAGRSQEAYKMIREQYRIGEDVQFMFAMILRQFRILLELRDVFEKEDLLDSNILAKRLELHPFVVKKSLPMVRKYDMPTLKAAYHQLLELDIGIKTGQENGEVLLDLFVGKVCIN